MPSPVAHTRAPAFVALSGGDARPYDNKANNYVSLPQAGD